MVEPGRVLTNAGRGERLVVLATAAETGGHAYRFEYVTDRRGMGPPVSHVHPLQEERFRVVAGSATFRVAGRDRTLGAGQSTAVPAGVAHRFWNAIDGETRVHVEFVPALRSEHLFHDLWTFAVAGKSNRWGIPRDPLVAMVLAHRYREESALAGVPVWLQRGGVKLLMPAARLLGAVARYERIASAPGPR